MKKGFTIGKTRSALYKTAKILGDVNSIKRKRVSKRVTNRIIGKISGRLASAISRGILKLLS